MSERMVKCVKLGKELPGLEEPPFDNDIGRRVYENISQQAWEMFAEHFKMVANEYRLNLADKETDEIFFKMMEDFFFGEGAEMPEGYVPPGMGKGGGGIGPGPTKG